MKKLAAVLLIACTIGLLGCKTTTGPESTVSSPSDNQLLALALTHKFDDGGFTVVMPETGTGLTVKDPGDMEKMKEYVGKQLHLQGVDMNRLLDAFAAKNHEAARLTLDSAPERGYIVDYNREYGKYFEKDGGGWERWHREHPKAHGSTTVSLPVWDKQTSVVLLYVGAQFDYLAGAGHLIAYKFDGTTLREVGRVMLWIS